MDLVQSLFGDVPNANLCVSAFGLVWTFAAIRRPRDTWAWVAWLGFWASCVVYYPLLSWHTRLFQEHYSCQPWWHAAWVPNAALYPGTALLLIGYGRSDPRLQYVRWLPLASLALVVAAGAAGVAFVCNNKLGDCHQALTCIAIGLWAWRLRQMDEVRALVVATYALSQLPWETIVALIGESPSRKEFLQATYYVYFYLKIPLLAASYASFSRSQLEPRLFAAPVEGYDVMISYAREDQARAGKLVLALEEKGLRVWWDEKIPARSSWRGTIGNALMSLRCVVVLWSQHSVGSHFVNEEAEAARERGVLVSARIEPIDLPFGFREEHALPYFKDADSAAFDELVDAIRKLVPEALERRK